MPGIMMAATMVVMMVVMAKVIIMDAAAAMVPGPKTRPRRCRNPSCSEP
jgi:hypothetical protein